jgi:hypothetical protein
MTEQDDNRETGVCRPAASGGTTAGRVAPCRPVVRREGEVVVIDIPMAFRRRSGRKEVVLPSGAITSVTPPKLPSPLALAVARALAWQEMIEAGEVESISDLARRLKLDTSFVARTIRLAALAPGIIEAILDGQEPKGLLRKSKRMAIPTFWDEQHKQIGLGQ